MTNLDDANFDSTQHDYELSAQLRRVEIAVHGTPTEKGKGGLRGDLFEFSRVVRKALVAIVCVASLLFAALYINSRYNIQQQCFRSNARSSVDTKRLYDQGREYGRAIGGTDAQADTVTRKILQDDPPPVRACPAILPLVK